MEIESVAAITLNFLPFDACAKFMSGSYQFDRNGLLAGTDENDDVNACSGVRDPPAEHFKINEQELLIHGASQDSLAVQQ
jgi:hypothetical protein